MDSTSFPSGGHKIYHERSTIGDMLSAIHYKDNKGLEFQALCLYLCREVIIVNSKRFNRYKLYTARRGSFS